MEWNVRGTFCCERGFCLLDSRVPSPPVPVKPWPWLLVRRPPQRSLGPLFTRIVPRHRNPGDEFIGRATVAGRGRQGPSERSPRSQLVVRYSLSPILPRPRAMSNDSSSDSYRGCRPTSYVPAQLRCPDLDNDGPECG